MPAKIETIEHTVTIPDEEWAIHVRSQCSKRGSQKWPALASVHEPLSVNPMLAIRRPLGFHLVEQIIGYVRAQRKEAN